MFPTSDLLLPFLVTVQGDTQAVEIGKIQKNQRLTSSAKQQQPFTLQLQQNAFELGKLTMSQNLSVY